MASKATAPIGETDQRILTKKLLNGEITAEQLQAYRDSLPDLSDQAKAMAVVWEPRPRPVAAGRSGDVD